MTSIISHIITFFGGLLIGVLGNYIADRWTKKSKVRDSKQFRRKEFMELKEKMPDLFKEMKEDLQKQDFNNCRDFFRQVKELLLIIQIQLIFTMKMNTCT